MYRFSRSIRYSKSLRLQNYSRRFRDKNRKLNILSSYAHVVHTTANWFHVVEITRTSAKCARMKNVRAKLLFFTIKGEHFRPLLNWKWWTDSSSIYHTMISELLFNVKYEGRRTTRFIRSPLSAINLHFQILNLSWSFECFLSFFQAFFLRFHFFPAFFSRHFSRLFS